MQLSEFISNYVQKKGLEFREAGNEQYVFKTCPACGDEKYHHFYMNMDEGLWDCKKCSAKGNFNQFRELLGDNAIQLGDYELNPVKASKPKEYKTLKYDLDIQLASRLWGSDLHYVEYLMNERLLDEAIIKEFKLGSSGEGIAIPIYEENKLVNVRYRRDPRKDNDPEAAPRYAMEKGCKPALFNGDVLLEGIKQVYVTEGEFDALQLIQRGFRNTVSVPLGAGYFSDSWIPKFEDVQEIYLIFDSDEEGKKGAKKAAEKLGLTRCKIVMLPTKEGRKKTDLTDYFAKDKHTKEDFVKLLSTSKSAAALADDLVKQLHEFNEPLRELLLAGEHIGEPTGYDQLDNLMGGLRKGRLVVVSGLTNVGKSSFVSNICMKLGVRGIPNYYLSMEMPPIDIAKKLLMLKAKISGEDIKKIEDPSPTLELIDKTLCEFKGSGEEPPLPIYLYNGSGVLKYEILEKSAKIAKEEYGVRCIFIDHLHYFSLNSNNLAAETSKVVRQVKQLAMELDLTIVLLAHLNRGGRTKSRTGLYTPSLADLKETSTIEQDADQVLFVCRDSENEDDQERGKTFIKVAKNRDGRAGPSISMIFHEDTTVFDEAEVGINYEKESKEKEEKLNSPLQEEAPSIF